MRFTSRYLTFIEFQKLIIAGKYVDRLEFIIFMWFEKKTWFYVESRFVKLNEDKILKSDALKLHSFWRFQVDLQNWIKFYSLGSKYLIASRFFYSQNSLNYWNSSILTFSMI